MFQGSLSSWWTKIVIGLLTLVFCLFQKVFERSSARKVYSTRPTSAARAA